MRDVIRLRGRTRRRVLPALAALAILMPLVGAGVASAASVTPTPNGAWSPYKACPKQSQASENCAAVRAIARTADGTVFLGGDFTKLRNNSTGATKDVTNLAAVDDNGTPVAGFATHTFDGIVYTLATDGTSLYVGGDFTKVDGVANAHLAKFSLPGLALQTFTTGFDGTIYGSVLTGGKLYVGGKFTSVQGSTRGNLAALDPATGTVDPVWAPDAELIPGDVSPNDPPHNDVPIRALAVSPDGTRIYVGGDMDTLNGTSQPALAAVDPTTGAPIPDFNTYAGYMLSTGVQTMAIVPVDATDGRTTAGVVVAAGGLLNRAYLLNTNGLLARMINTDGDVQAAAVKGTTVYFGGHFTCISMLGCPTTPPPIPDSQTVTRVHLVALDYNTPWLDTASGAIDADFAPAMAPIGPPYFYGVYVLQSYGDSLYAGGVFKNVVINGKTYPNSKFVRFGPSIGPPPPPPPPAPGTSLFSDDFATNDTSHWSVVGAGMTVANGSASGANVGQAAFLGGTLSQTSTKVEAAVKVTVTKLDPQSKVVLLRLTRTVAGVRKGVADVFVKPTGVLGVRNEVGGVDWLSTIKLTKGVQHTLDLKVIAAGKSGKSVLSLDGAPIAALTKTANLGAAAVDSVQIGDTNLRSYTISWDDVSVLAG